MVPDMYVFSTSMVIALKVGIDGGGIKIMTAGNSNYYYDGGRNQRRSNHVGKTMGGIKYHINELAMLYINCIVQILHSHQATCC